MDLLTASASGLTPRSHKETHKLTVSLSRPVFNMLAIS